MDLEIRYLSRTSGLIQGRITPLVSKATWELTDAGGIGAIQLQLKDSFSATLPPPGSIIELLCFEDPVLGGTVEPAARVRGIASLPDSSVGLSEEHSITAYGFASDMANVRFDAQLIEPGGVDISWFAGQIITQYLKARPWLAERCDTLILPCGVSRETLEFDNSDCRSAISQLAAQGPGVVVWGWRVDPVSGKDQFVFAPRTAAVKMAVAVGKQVTRLQRPRDLSSVVNAVELTGGQAMYPNLLAAAVEGNTSFEKAYVAGATAGNLLLNPGFESNFSNWTGTGGSDIQDSGSNGPVRTGKYMGHLDNNGEKLAQTVNGALAVGKKLGFSIFARRRVGTDTRIGYLTLALKDAGNTVIFSKSIPVGPTSATWQEFKGALEVPVGSPVTKFTYDIEGTTGTGTLLVDDCSVWDSDSLKPTGWETITSGSAKFTTVDPAYRAVSWHGSSSIRIAGTFSGSSNRGHLRPAGEARFAVSGNQTLIFSIRARRAPGFAGPSGAMKLELKPFNSTTSNTTIATNAITDDWQIFWHQATMPAGAKDCLAQILFDGDTDILIDAVQVCDLAQGTPLAANQPDSLKFLEADKFTRSVLATDVCTPGSAAYLSESQYDRRTRYLSNESIIQWDSAAQAWMKTWFEANAPLPEPWSVDVLSEPGERYDPLTGDSIRVTNLEKDLPDLPAARSAWGWDTSGLTCKLELDVARPDLARLLSVSKSSVSGSGSGTIRAAGGVSGGTTPETSASFSDQNANKVFAGPASGADAQPGFRAIVAADIAGDLIDPTVHIPTYTINDSIGMGGNTARLTTQISRLADRIKAIVGGANWYSSIPESLTSLKSRVDTLFGRNINTGTGLSGGGNLSADRNLSLANTTVTPGSYTSANITVDAQGRLTAASNGSGGGGGSTRPTQVLELWEEFVNGTTGPLLPGLAWAFSGGFTTSTYIEGTGAEGTVFGAVTLASNGSSSAWGGYLHTSPSAYLIRPGINPMVFTARVKIDTLSTSGQAFTVRAGAIDTLNGDSTEGWYLRYTHSANSGKWQLVHRAGGVESAVDTGIAPSPATWVTLEIFMNAAGDSFTCKIGGVAGSNTLNAGILSFNPTTGWGISMAKSAGTTSRTLQVDALGMQITRTIPF